MGAPLLDNRSYWQRVAATFGSFERDERRDSWFESDQPSDEEADWWNFLGDNETL